MNNTIDIDNEKMQRTAFQKWYALNIGSKNSTSTISRAINQVRLKNSGKNVFSINNPSELESVLSDKTDFFQKRDGDYSKMDDIFEFNENVQMDDLKSGIKYYLKFLERIDEIKKINLYTSINKFEAQIIQIDFSDSVKLNSIQEKIVRWDYKQPQKFANIYNICDTDGNHNYNDDDQKACFL